MRVLVVQHDPDEGCGAVADWAKARGASIHTVHVYRGELLPPELGGIGLVVLMGGPMSVNDEEELAWLVPEKRWLAQVLKAGVPCLGICLGAQLIANVLGAAVTRQAEKEIGWFSVTVNADGQKLLDWPPTLTPLHWHGETFALPTGATHLASSAACANQAFLWGERVVSLQFHIEATVASTSDLTRTLADEITDGPWQHPPERLLADTALHAPAMNQVLFRLLDRLTA